MHSSRMDCHHRASARRAVQTCRMRRSSGVVRAAAADPENAVVILPGFLYGASAYGELARNFRAKGRAVGGSFDFYLDAAMETVTRVHKEHGAVALVAHSAGGWLARVLLGSQPYNERVWGAAPMVHSLVCLGTPHLCQEDYPYGRIPEQLKLTPEQTARAPPEVAANSLCFANFFYPASSSIPDVHTVCVVGRAVQGEDTQAFALLPEPFATERSRKQLAFASYKANCGRGDVWGDGVCPLETGMLPGADVVQLQDVWHMHGGGRQWYGSSDVVAFLDTCITDNQALAASVSLPKWQLPYPE